VFIGAIEDQFGRPNRLTSPTPCPATFDGKNGKQYVAVMAGGGNAGAKGPGRLYVYSFHR
jgi:hypothetical protein